VGTRGPKPEHSRETIAQAAISLADAGGLAAASMRAVAKELGTTGGALYRYVASRDELLDAMVDTASARLKLPEPTGDWLADLLRIAGRQRDLFKDHPWLVEALSGRTPGPATTAFFRHCLSLLDGVEAGEAAKHEAIAMMTGVVTLFARGEGYRPSLFERTVTSVLKGLLGTEATSE
jgi:AcrR family transcriptional regulator